MFRSSDFIHRRSTPRSSERHTRFPIHHNTILATGSLVWICSAAGLSLSRQGGIPAWRTLWAEDATIFLRAAWAKPPGLTSISVPYSGYLNVVPRLLAIPITWLPVEWAAATTSIVAAVVFGLVGLSILRISGSILRHLGTRAFIGAAPVLLPSMAWENLNNITYLLWLFLFAGFWSLLAPSRNRSDTLIRSSLLLIGALTHPMLIIYLPIAVYISVRRHQRGDRVATSALGIGLAIQFAVVLSVDQIPRQSIKPVDAVLLGLQRVIGSSVLGERGLEVGWERWGWAWIILSTFTLIVILLTLSLNAGKPQLFNALIALTYAGLAFAVAIVDRGSLAFSPIEDQYNPAGARYCVVPVLLIWSALAILIDDARPTLNWRLASVVTATILSGATFSSWHLDNLRSKPPEWHLEVATVADQCLSGRQSVFVKSSPAGWIVEVPCREFN